MRMSLARALTCLGAFVLPMWSKNGCTQLILICSTRLWGASFVLLFVSCWISSVLNTVHAICVVKSYSNSKPIHCKPLHRPADTTHKPCVYFLGWLKERVFPVRSWVTHTFLGKTLLIFRQSIPFLCLTMLTPEQLSPGKGIDKRCKQTDSLS